MTNNEYEDLTTGAGKVQADGAFAIPAKPVVGSRRTVYHQVTIEPVGSITGTVALKYTPRGGSVRSNIVDAFGAALVHNFANGAGTYEFKGNLDDVHFTPTAVSGTYNVIYSCWSEG